MTLVETRADLVHAYVPFADLDAATTGTVAVQGSEEYDALVSPWNLAVPVRPAAVLAARTPQDVVEAVRFAARHGLLVTPQATGHGPIAELVGAILVNTSGLDECVVHPEGWARVGAGVKWIRVVQAAAPYGLAPLSGSITDVGIVGYTTGGGLGPMARTYGLAIDRVRAIEVVTGDGVLRRVTPTQDPELFFGLRGGKGMLGIVTAIEFDLVHQPTFYGGSLWFDGEHAATVIDRWRRWSADLPEEATTSFALFQLPRMPGVPDQLAERLRCRSATSGPVTREGSALVRRDARSRARPPRRCRAQALHRRGLGPHRPARPAPGPRGRRGAHRLPGRGRGRPAGDDRARLGIAAGPGRGTPDGRRDRARWSARERLLRARRGVRRAPGRHRRNPGARGPP